MKNRMDLGPRQPAVVFSSDRPELPAAFKAVQGVLVFRDTQDVILHWDRQDREWVPLNEAGWGITFGTAIPEIELGHWAIVQVPEQNGVVTILDIIYALVQTVATPLEFPHEHIETSTEAVREAEEESLHYELVN